MTIILGNMLAFFMSVFLLMSIIKIVNSWKVKGGKYFFAALFKGFVWAIGTSLVSIFIFSFYLNRCLQFSMPFQVFLILFFWFVAFVSFSDNHIQRFIVSIIYIILLFLLSYPAKIFGDYFYSPYIYRLRSVTAYKSIPHTIEYPSSWLDDLPIKDAVLDYWGWSVLPNDGKILVIKPQSLWHSFFTGLYAIDAKSVKIWYPGGTITDSINKLEFREKENIHIPQDCFSNC